MSSYFRLHPQAETRYADEFLAKRAVAVGKKVNAEFDSQLTFTEYMARMSAKAQDEYISWLLTYLDEQDRGLNDELPFAWAIGRPPQMTRSLQRMIRMPSLYEVMQTRRNKWWAMKIEELLEGEGSFFVAVGMLHTMGPASIPNQLASIGIRLKEVRY